MFRYFSTRNFEIATPQSFYILSFDNLYPAQKFLIRKISISQLEKLLNISGVQMISKILKIKFENNIIE